MALPTSRNTNYAPTDPMKSADANDLQDQIIALYNGAHGERTLWLAAAAAHGTAAGAPLTNAPFNALVDLFVGWGWVSATGNDVHVELEVPLPAGSRIQSITAYITEANLAGEEIELELYERDLVANTRTQRSTTKTSGVSGAAASLGWTTADADLPYVMPTDKGLTIVAKLKNTSASFVSEFRGVKIVYDRP